MSGTLRLACIDSEAPPLFLKSVDGVNREGYEPDAARAVADQLGKELVWVIRPWGEMVPSVLRGEADAVWCGQGISEERKQVSDFTRPYAVFDEGVLVRRGSGIRSAEDLVGRRVGAIAGSVNLALARTFTGCEPVEFGGDSDDVFGEMIAALRGGDVDAFVDDDVALIPVGEEADLEVGFLVRTRNPWGISVSKARPDLLAELDGALAAVIADGRLEQAWKTWMPTLDYPFRTD